MSNVEVIAYNMKMFLAKKVQNDIIGILERVAEQIYESCSVPVVTGNLQDSTGIGIYHGDVLRRFVPNQSAEVSRSNIYPAGLTTRDNIWGHNQLQEAINKGAMRFSNDYYLVIFSAMPYANLVNIRTDYFDEITAGLKPLIVSIIKQTE